MSPDGSQHVVAALLLLGRLGDVVSTWIVTPTLRLEANPVVRALRWRIMIASMLVALAPYFSLRLGIAVLVPSLLVSSSNLARGWVSHALGEAEMEHIAMRAAELGRRRVALAFVVTGAFFTCLTGCVLLWISQYDSLPYWFGFGLLLFGMAQAAFDSSYVVRTYGAVQTPRIEAEACDEAHAAPATPPRRRGDNCRV